MLGPFALDRLLVCGCGILFLLASQQNQHHTSTHYPQALAVRALGESLVKCSRLHIISDASGMNSRLMAQ